MESVICVWNFCLQKNWGWKSRKTSLIRPYASACKNALISGKVPGNIDVKTLSKPIEKSWKQGTIIIGRNWFYLCSVMQ